MKHLLLLLALTLIGFGASSTCQAQSSSRVILHAGPNIGLGGQLSLEDWAPPFRGSQLAPTYGGYAGVEGLLHPNFTLGAEVGLSAWNEQRMEKHWDRQKQIDLLLRPLVRFAPMPKLELYGVVPFGFTYCIPADDLDSTDEEGWLTYSWAGGAGFSIGAAIGARFFFLEHLGLSAEAGYAYRKFQLVVEESTAAGGQRDRVAHGVSLSQLQLRVGVATVF